MFEDPHSAVFRFGETLVNLLQVDTQPSWWSPRPRRHQRRATGSSSPSEVDDVDAMCESLGARGVTLLNGPMDRPWGPRTASFRDPGGHIWEIAH